MRGAPNGLILGGMLLLAFPASAAADAYLKLDGVNGASNGQAATIALSDVSYASGRPITSAPSAVGPDRSDTHTIHIVRNVDWASPTLWAAAASAEHFPAAAVCVRNAKGETCRRLSDVVISGFETDGQPGAADQHPTEQFTLNFATLGPRQ
jgi:type VI protein secretion system component Hcp